MWLCLKFVACLLFLIMLSDWNNLVSVSYNNIKSQLDATIKNFIVESSWLFILLYERCTVTQTLDLVSVYLLYMSS